MNVTILTDEHDSWFVEYGYQLLTILNELDNVYASYVFNSDDISDSNDLLFILSCVKLVPDSTLGKSKNNIVIHASDLPAGKGFSPLQWQIRNGFDSIILTLFEAVKDVDAGEVYIKEKLEFEGNELLPELRKKMALKIIDMCVNFIVNFKKIKSFPQVGKETFFRRLDVSDDELDPAKTINELMDQLRSADFEKYPPYFYFKGRKFFLRLSSDD
ncbi:methionyl-tRNA formyltransferase [Shewanella algae]|uniref:methionyl-tRNA formyltransferase n=1 Tax=Shewanella algae TaxID=38313 RepID=UPI003005D7D2